MHKTLSLRFAALALLGAAFVSPLQARAENCPGENQASMNQCADKAFRAADAALNKRYKEITARLADSPEGHTALVAAQQAWIAFRDKECAFVASSVAGGSVAPMIVADCMAGLTEARTVQLAGYLECPEGDLTCPVP